MALDRSIHFTSAFPPSVLGRWLLPVAMLVCLLGSGRAEEELPLPQWTDEELRAFREQNVHVPSLEALLPEPSGLTENLDEVLRGPLKSGPRLDDLPERLTGELQPRLTLEHMRSFLPETDQSSHVEIRSAQPVDGTAPTAIAALRTISPEFMKAAAGMPGDLYFIDPDSRVPEMSAMELTRLLERHRLRHPDGFGPHGSPWGHAALFQGDALNGQILLEQLHQHLPPIRSTRR